jgi:hypothetical protein
MTILGKGAVAIWHDIAPAGRAAFYAWHGQEHMPERVGIEGFNRGRRFIAIDADREFFNLYETADEDVVKGAAYLARLENPTPWTIATVAHFRAVARSLCRVAGTAGAADGGLVATVRYSVPAEAAQAHEERMAGTFLPELTALPGIAAVHLLAADLEASGFVNAEQRARGTANEVPSHALVVEGWADEADFIDAVKGAIARIFADKVSEETTPSVGFYRQQITVWKG